MKLIVGLGNPGTRYLGTRHNIGSAVVKEFCRRHKAALKRGLFSAALSAKVKLHGIECVLAVPLTYMNLSGAAVLALVKKHRIAGEDLLVVCDDLDLELGRVRLRRSGSDNGHNGVASVIAALDTRDFCRLRLGIGRPAHRSADTADYVLSAFTGKETARIPEFIDDALQAIESWIELGIEKTMNTVNRRGEEKDE
ncbi:MAG: aminoacyl-tRNA hydrolase [Candidatus Omnitrophica bacterium]|nr:aminoacyl-tRNA hydrolase [Candidatus Omnitrophota bacterium]